MHLQNPLPSPVPGDVSGWENQSTENKPFLAVDDSGNVFVTDPAGFRVPGIYQ